MPQPFTQCCIPCPCPCLLGMVYNHWITLCQRVPLLFTHPLPHSCKTGVRCSCRPVWVATVTSTYVHSATWAEGLQAPKPKIFTTRPFGELADAAGRTPAECPVTGLKTPPPTRSCWVLLSREAGELPYWPRPATPRQSRTTTPPFQKADCAIFKFLKNCYCLILERGRDREKETPICCFTYL